jgi:hypothetical protein
VGVAVSSSSEESDGAGDIDNRRFCSEFLKDFLGLSSFRALFMLMSCFTGDVCFRGRPRFRIGVVTNGSSSLMLELDSKSHVSLILSCLWGDICFWFRPLFWTGVLIDESFSLELVFGSKSYISLAL